MDLNKLRYFMAVAETEHVTKAAQQLSIAQPALTRALHRLEDELGVQLFVRDGRNIRLTSEGAYLRDRCAAPLAELSGIEQAVRALSEDEHATISICMKSASVLVVDAIAEYSAAHPDVVFKVTQEDRPDFADVIIASEPWANQPRGTGFAERIGIALPAARSAREWQEVGAACKLGDDHSENEATSCSIHSSSSGSAIMAECMRATNSPIELDSLRDESFILLAGSRGLRPQCDRLCEARGFHPRIAFESENPSVVRKMVCLGMGIGFWPEYSWGPLDTGSTWFPLADDEFRRFVRLAITPRGMEKEAARYFKRFLADYLAAAFA